MLVLFDGDLGERETLRFIEEKLHAGIWSWDLATGNMEWSHGFFSLLGIEPDSIKPSSTVLSQMVHPDDRPPSEAVSRTLNEGLPAEWGSYHSPERAYRWIATRSELRSIRWPSCSVDRRLFRHDQAARIASVAGYRKRPL
jgi:hypothetical protein